MPKFSPVKLSNTTEKSGFSFYCPGCKTHHYIQTHKDFTPCWDFNGDVEKPTVSPSVLVRGGSKGNDHVCHSFIKDGLIQFLSDCSHSLRNQTVEIPDFDEH